jgi:hypothetical protein
MSVYSSHADNGGRGLECYWAPRVDLAKDQYDIGRRSRRALLSWAALTLLLGSWTFPISAQSVSYAGSAQVLRDYEAKLSTSDVDALELRVQYNADDLKSREILISYYTLKAVKPKRLEHALWLIRNHPEAVIDCPDARLSEEDSPLDSMAAFRRPRPFG